MSHTELFNAAAKLPPDERAAFLDRTCGADPALRREVESLLRAHDAPDSFLHAPAGRTATYDSSAEGPGTRVGPYKLLQEIGEGGMGTVFMAEQEEPVRRMVAVKIIRAGMDSKGVLARFEAERQALALMDHPNIAKVLDAGTTEGGSPYFVMELVKGVPITRFCDENQLSLRERLELFIPVCQAIQHAHMKGIIHRDVKPSNVLVAMYDDKPVPKVIDFGVAKATSQKLTDKTLFTAFGAVVGTLEYMSPEQAKLNQLDIDTRSDVYALGVLLYELLTGSTPLDRVRLKSAALDEVLRLIREEEPPKPSTRLSTAATLPQIAAARKSAAAQLGKVVRGELDWIVMKSLEKDRARRYDTAIGLARDVERYLKDEAVEACPPTWGYRLRKAYRRNKAAVLTGGLIAAVLLFGTAGTTWGMVWAVGAERQAKEDRDAAVKAEEQAAANERLARTESERLKVEQDRTRRLLYASQMSAVSIALAENRIPLVVQHLQDAIPKPGEPDLRDWEWHYVNRHTDTGKMWELPAFDGRRMNEVLGTVFSPVVIRGNARWLASFRPVDNGFVYDFHDPATGRRVGQIPKDGPPLAAPVMGLPMPIVSADSRFVLARRPGAKPGGRPEDSPPRIWEIETGREIDMTGLPPFGSARGVDTLVVGPEAAWVSWLDWDTGKGGGGPPALSPLVGPAEVRVHRWERGKGLLPPKAFRLGDGPGRVSLSSDGNSVFWLPGRAFPTGPGGGRDVGANPGIAKYSVECWGITGEPKSRWKEPITAPVPRFTGRPFRIPDIALSPAQTMIGVRENDEIVIYRTMDQSKHWTVPIPPGLGDAGVGQVKFFLSDDGNRVVFVAPNTLLVREKAAANRVVSRQFHFRGVDRTADRGAAGDLNFHLLPDGKTVVATRSGSEQVRVWDVSRDPDASDDAKPNFVQNAVTRTEDGQNVLSRDDGRVTVKWQVVRFDPAQSPGPSTAQPLLTTVFVTRQRPGMPEPEQFELPGGTRSQTRNPQVTFVDQGRKLLLNTYRPGNTPAGAYEPRENWEWALYDLETPGKLPRIVEGTGRLEVIRNSPYFLINSPLTQFQTTDTFEIYNARSGELVHKHTVPTPCYAGSESFDSTGSRFITLTPPVERQPHVAYPLTLEVWETATHKRLWSAALGEVGGLGSTHARFSPDGQFVVVDYDAGPKSFIRVASADNGGNVKLLELTGHPDRVLVGSGTVRGGSGPQRPSAVRKGGETSPSLRESSRPSSVLGFSPNSRFMAAQEKAGSMVGVWDLHTGTRVHSLPCENDSRPSVLFNSEETRLFVIAGGRTRGGENARIRMGIWDLVTGRELLTLPTGAGPMRYHDGRVYLQYPDRALDGRPQPDPKK